MTAKPLDKTKIDPNRLLEILNSINPSIYFTMETSDKKQPFLDILIKGTMKKYGIHLIQIIHPYITQLRIP